MNRKIVILLIFFLLSVNVLPSVSAYSFRQFRGIVVDLNFDDNYDKISECSGHAKVLVGKITTYETKYVVNEEMCFFEDLELKNILQYPSFPFPRLVINAMFKKTTYLPIWVNAIIIEEWLVFDNLISF